MNAFLILGEYGQSHWIGPHTVNTMPEPTIAAFSEHGTARLTMEEWVDQAHLVIEELGRLGIDFRLVTAPLENEGIQKSIEPCDALLNTLSQRC